MTDADVALARTDRRVDLAVRAQRVRLELALDRDPPEPIAARDREAEREDILGLTVLVADDGAEARDGAVGLVRRVRILDVEIGARWTAFSRSGAWIGPCDMGSCESEAHDETQTERCGAEQRGVAHEDLPHESVCGDRVHESCSESGGHRVERRLDSRPQRERARALMEQHRGTVEDGMASRARAFEQIRLRVINERRDRRGRR